MNTVQARPVHQAMQPVRVEEFLWSPGQNVPPLDAADAQHDQNHAVEASFGSSAYVHDC